LGVKGLRKLSGVTHHVTIDGLELQIITKSIAKIPIIRTKPMKAALTVYPYH
jgi:hypothetical protein